MSAQVGNPWSRLTIVHDGSGAYGLAATWNGTGWQRVGSLYPVIEFIGTGGAPVAVEMNPP